MTDIDVPRSGPCSPWITGQAVQEQAQNNPTLEGTDIPATLAAECAEVASAVLYARSARQFTGACGPVTVRPIERPTDIDTRFGNRGMPAGYITAGQYGAAWGLPNSGAVNHYGTSKPPTIDLGVYPVTQIVSVYIDGILIPSNEYRLQFYRQLVRVRPPQSAEPTARWGWPVAQNVDMPDTQPGTCSVTYMYGAPPPIDGVRAARVLAQQLLLNDLGQSNSLPQRITSISRQGVSAAVADVEDMLKAGMLGIWDVDVFVDTYNPTHARLRPQVWSPDVGRPVRMPPGQR